MHQKPTDFSQRSWRTAQKIIRYVGTVDGVFLYDHKRPMSLVSIARGVGISIPRVKQLLSRLTRDRIIGRHIRRLGRGAPALTWVCHPAQQIIALPETKRTARVAAVLPHIRHALLADRESLRPVAKRFGVSLDTVLDERRRVAPYDSDTAHRRRCPGCGATITSERCLRCTLSSS